MITAVCGPALLGIACAGRGDVERIDARLDAMNARDGEILAAVARLDSLLDSHGRAHRVDAAAGNATSNELGGEMSELRAQLDGLGARMDAMQAGLLPGAPPAEATADTTLDAIETAALYRQAYLDVTRGDFDMAREGLLQFMELAAESPLADDARYWLAECYLAEGRAADALEHFRQVVHQHPEGDMVPASLLKVGLTLLEMGRRGEARAAFLRVEDEFPDSEEARVAADRRRELGEG